MTLEASCSRSLKGDLMIHSVEIQNFRCFENLMVTQCGRINVAVGDNGSGKTALLEAIFLALGATTDLPLCYRQQRGLEGLFSGSTHAIEEAIFGDLFYDRDYTRIISIVLRGSGEDNRSIHISRGPSKTVLPLEDRASSVGSLSFVFT